MNYFKTLSYSYYCSSFEVSYDQWTKISFVRRNHSNSNGWKNNFITLNEKQELFNIVSESKIVSSSNCIFREVNIKIMNVITAALNDQFNFLTNNSTEVSQEIAKLN